MMPASTAPLLSLRGIRKRFGGVVALDGVDFELRAGEIHALLGENGAGKSTLIKILGGIHQPDDGEVQAHGSATQIGSVTDADTLGIRLIHQELAANRRASACSTAASSSPMQSDCARISACRNSVT
jgi:ribose transport system ATP-binding protein